MMYLYMNVYIRAYLMEEWGFFVALLMVCYECAMVIGGIVQLEAIGSLTSMYKGAAMWNCIVTG